MRLTWVAAFGLVACGPVKGDPPDHPEAAVPTREVVVELPAVPNRDLDILFVVDNSNTMATKQDALAANFPNFIDKLQAIPGGLPNIHLGVVTTDMGTSNSTAAPASPIGQPGQGGCQNTGDNGNLQVGLATGITGTFITDIQLTDGTRQTNYAGCRGGNLAQCFGDMAKVGATGCGFEQPLSSMKAALDGNTANAGFLRASALLAVVFLTDEDDCSVKDPILFGNNSAMEGPLDSFRCARFGVTCDVNGVTSDDMNNPNVKQQCHDATAASAQLDPVSTFHDFLISKKGDDRHIILGGIIGDPTPVEVTTSAASNASILKPSCSITINGLTANADPAVRIQSFFDSFDNRSATSTICQADFSQALGDVGDLVATSVGTPCVGKPIVDGDPNTPGFQPDCIVEDLIGASVTRIDECDASATPTCWRMVADAQLCPLFDHLKLEVVRDGTPNPNTITRASCVVP